MKGNISKGVTFASCHLRFLYQDIFTILVGFCRGHLNDGQNSFATEPFIGIGKLSPNTKLQESGMIKSFCTPVRVLRPPPRVHNNLSEKY